VPVLQPSARTEPLLRAVALGLKASDKAIKRDISATTRTTLNPIWREAIATHAAGSRMDYKVFGTGARVAAGNPSKAVAASSRRGLRKGKNPLIPNELGRMMEFPPGADLKATTYQRKSAKGGTHSVTRHTMRGLPARRKGGRVVYPAWADTAPRMVSLWVQIVVRNLHEALEEKG
jgi:hypothetical protein